MILGPSLKGKNNHHHTGNKKATTTNINVIGKLFVELWEKHKLMVYIINKNSKSEKPK